MNCDRDQRERGATTIEMSLSILIYLFIILAGIDLMRVSYSALTLQYAAASTARAVSVSGNLTSLKGSNIISEFLRQAKRFNVSLTPPPAGNDVISICPAWVDPCTGMINAGPDQWIQIEARKSVPVLFGAFTKTLTAEALIKTEPF